MKFTAAVVLAAAAGVSASYNMPSNVTYTTEVVEVYTTYCPGPTEITHGANTYTVTEATTLTITDCPCTVSYPVIPTSIVECHTCGPAYPTGEVPVPTPVYPTGDVPDVPAETPVYPPPVETAAAGRVAALSGAGLAAIVGVAAFL